MTIKIIQTGDIHGCFFPHDFLRRKEATASLSHISSYIKEQRRCYGSNLIVVDLGDIIQGQPTCYHSLNISDTGSNLSAKLLNELKYDAICIGNHDIETGHRVFDKWTKDTDADILGANAIRIANGKPYFNPYKKVTIGNIKIVILGLITNAIPYWLSKRLWEGIRFDNPIESTRKWVGIIKEKEKPDIIIGLFHTGWEGGVNDGEHIENATRQIAEEIDGLDIILYGHDHIARNQTIRNKYGKNVLCMNASSNAEYINDVTIGIEMQDENSGHENISEKSHGTKANIKKTITGKQVRVDKLPVDTTLTNQYKPEITRAKEFCDTVIGMTDVALRTRDCYFGDSTLAALIHNIQLEVTGAQISFTAPLAYDETIDKGIVRIADIFNMYKYENTIVAMMMKGSEVKKYLEYSYAKWVNRMKDASSRLMKVSEYELNGKTCYFFKNLTFNFDTAYGISYTVDVKRDPGNMVNITKLSNGDIFDEEATYSVAMHSYRANGGNEFLTKGVGIPHSELSRRRLYESAMDERYYIIRKFMTEKIISPATAANWKFIPEEWTHEAVGKEREELFHDDFKE